MCLEYLLYNNLFNSNRRRYMGDNTSSEMSESMRNIANEYDQSAQEKEFVEKTIANIQNI